MWFLGGAIFSLLVASFLLYVINIIGIIASYAPSLWRTLIFILGVLFLLFIVVVGLYLFDFLFGDIIRSSNFNIDHVHPY